MLNLAVAHPIKSLVRLICFACLLNCNNATDLIYQPPYSIKNNLEVGNNLLMQPGFVLYTKNIDGYYQLFKYDFLSKTRLQITQEHQDVDYPFALFHELYFLCGQRLRQNTPHGSLDVFPILFETPFSMAAGSEKEKFVFLKIKDIDSAIIVNAEPTLSLKKILLPEGTINSVCFSEKWKWIVICAGQRIYKMPLSGNVFEEVLPNIASGMSTPFIDENRLYFSSAINNDKAALFSCKLLSSDSAIRLELRARNDLRLPRKSGDDLFFVEVCRGEYLLKYKNLKSDQVTTITDSGVVYNYGFNKTNGNIVLIQSDVGTPKGLTRTDKNRGIERLDCNKYQSYVSGRLLNNLLDTGFSYQLSPVPSKIPKGIILYFHPGRMNGDFSPRWDNMIYPLVTEGYLLIAPNFPGSIGYGRRYASLSTDDAISYMNQCIDSLSARYPGLPLFLYGLSSGCPIMEACITSRPDKINGVISAFGLSNGEPLPDKVPVLYILGKLDEIIPYSSRRESLDGMKFSHPKQSILVLEKSGHWIQAPDEFDQFFSAAHKFMEQH